MSAEIQELIDQIRSDNTSGATALTRLAAKAMSRSSALDETARALVAAQPAMAPILNLVNTVLLDARGAAACDEFLESLAANSEAAIRHGASLIQRSQTVLTHSFSSAVLDTLLAARCEVICTESRPICEGLDLARELAAAGIHVTLIVDAAMLAGLHRADLVLVGADSISAHGVTNKTGTAPLAELAASLSVPFYVICTSEKFLPAGYVPPAEPPKAASELAVNPQEPIRVENFYFDHTPLERVTGFITESGVLSSDQVRQRLSAQRLPAK